ncbi:MAG: class II poly(R)-hydroxyalkanoic acid synthase [Gammaproteobacteria bacterium]|nr:MAG: class II poly(R)-hydroxyalkanoic acid synthase [Gammaproteobacteria bacterium]
MADDKNANPATDDIAERTEGVAASNAFGVDGKAIMDAWGMVLNQATTQPRAVFEAGRKFAVAMTSIWLGSSDVDPGEADARFTDEAWSENPLFRRIGQSYLAWSNSLDDWLAASGLEGIEHDRARFVLSAAKDVLAPVNTLVGNPAALKKLRETHGASFVDGMRNVFDDIRHNHGYPAVADRGAFTVGVDVAATEGAVVFRNDLFELIQYQPKTAEVSLIPLLYVFSQVNRFYLGDLTPDRSLFQRLLDAGIPVFAISWRNPEKAHSQWNLDTYADGVIEAIRVMRKVTKQGKIHLMGLCAGGLVTAAAAGVMQARGDDWVDTLSLFVNVLDFRPGDSEFGLFVTERSVEAQKSSVRSRGLFSERDVFEMFAMLRIEENVMSFFRANYLLGEDPPKHPLLFWSMDYTRVPAEMQCTFLDLSQYNQLAKREMRILGKRVDLTQIDYPVYLMAGSTDHITPWRACYRSAQLFGGDVEFVLTNQNHTQTISSRMDNRHLKYFVASELPADPDAALKSATEYKGSWTNHWIEWLDARSEEKLSAPKRLGSKKFPVLGVAPGEYVLT